MNELSADFVVILNNLLQNKLILLKQYHENIQSLIAKLKNDDIDAVEQYNSLNNDITVDVDVIDNQIRETTKSLHSDKYKVIAAIVFKKDYTNCPEWALKTKFLSSEIISTVRELINLNNVAVMNIEEIKLSIKSELKKNNEKKAIKDYYLSQTKQIGIYLEKVT